MVGRSIELVFGDGQEEQGGSGSGLRINGARLEKDERTALRCGDEVVLAKANDSNDSKMGATQGKRQPLKGTKSASVQVGDGDEVPAQFLRWVLQ